jgi:hypothetical protein
MHLHWLCLSVAVATCPLQIVSSHSHRPPTVLVDVAVHDVEVARFLRKLMERIPDPIAHPVPHTCRAEVLLGQARVFRIAVRADDLTVGPTACANQYAEYPYPDPSSITRRAPTARAASSRKRPVALPTMGNPCSAAVISPSSG